MTGQLNAAFLRGCHYGQELIITWLLDNGIEIGTCDNDRQTGLHSAAIGGDLNTIKLLLERNAPLEVRNSYNGTPLGQALWSAAHGGDSDVYIPIIEALIAEGARPPERHVPVNARVDEVLERHGSRADPAR